MFSKTFKKCTRSVSNFRTEHLGGYFLDFCSPYAAEASLGREFEGMAPMAMMTITFQPGREKEQYRGKLDGHGSHVEFARNPAPKKKTDKRKI